MKPSALALCSVSLLASLAACGKKESRNDAPATQQEKVDEQKTDDQKPTEQKPAEPSVQPPASNKDIVGTWKTDCVSVGGASSDLSHKFAADGAWTFTMSFYSDDACKSLIETDGIDGSYKIGKAIANGSFEFDLLDSSDNSTAFLAFKIEGGKLKTSGVCRSADLSDSDDAYCYKRPAPIGHVAAARAVDLMTEVFTKVAN